jgi:hypothetical protein
MPAHASGKTSSGNSVVTYATSAAGFIQEIAKSTSHIPFLNVVAGVSLLILETVEVCALI